MDLGPIEERANEFATWVGKFDSAHRIPAAFASAADVSALLAEVKRLRTVYAEVDREALRRFVDSFCDDEAGEVEHVVSADGTSGFALTGGNDAHAVLRKAASALWPGESRAQVQAEALREVERAANHDWLAFQSVWGSSPSDLAVLTFANKALDWLRARADRLGGSS